MVCYVADASVEIDVCHCTHMVLAASVDHWQLTLSQGDALLMKFAIRLKILKFNFNGVKRAETKDAFSSAKERNVHLRRIISVAVEGEQINQLTSSDQGPAQDFIAALQKLIDERVIDGVELDWSSTSETSKKDKSVLVRFVKVSFIEFNLETRFW